MWQLGIIDVLERLRETIMPSTWLKAIPFLLSLPLLILLVIAVPRYMEMESRKAELGDMISHCAQVYGPSNTSCVKEIDAKGKEVIQEARVLESLIRPVSSQ